MADTGLFTEEQMDTINSVADKAINAQRANLKVYKVNEVHFPSGSPKNPNCCRIGLFTGEGHWHGEGNFCGWYGGEYYDEVTLLAYYEIENTFMYSPKGHPHLDEVKVNQYYDKIGIGSIYWERLIYAENDMDAISKFFAEAFEV